MSADDTLFLWPVGIFEDRYNGVYSGGKWVAIGRIDYEPRRKPLLENHWSGDFECSSYWNDRLKALTGQGATPDAALSDLETKANAMSEGAWNMAWLWDEKVTLG